VGCGQSPGQEKTEHLTRADDALQVCDSSVPEAFVDILDDQHVGGSGRRCDAQASTARPRDDRRSTGRQTHREKASCGTKQPQTSKSRCLLVRSAQLPRTGAASPVRANGCVAQSRSRPTVRGEGQQDGSQTILCEANKKVGTEPSLPLVVMSVTRH
jgi:hypothetical protein